MPKSILLWIVLAALTGFKTTVSESTIGAIDGKQIIASMHKVNRHRNFLEAKVGSEYPFSTGWQMGVYHMGNLAFSKLPGQDSVRNYTLKWAEANSWRISDSSAIYDCLPAAYCFFELENLGEKANILNAVKECNYQVANVPLTDYDCVDALFMGLPAFAELARRTGDSKYQNFLWSVYQDLLFKRPGVNNEKGLWEEPENLMWRDLHSKSGMKACNGEKQFWSRGNGWAFMTFPKTLEIMGNDFNHRKEFERRFKLMARKLLEIQHPEGFWYASLLDSTDCRCSEGLYYKTNLIESTGTAMFVYGFAWGINNGLLKAKEYRTAALKAWNWLVNTAQLKDGYLQYNQPSGNWPCSKSRSEETDFKHHMEAHGVGPFLMAGAEMYKLVN